MEWVASQPLPPSKNRHANTRLVNLFHNPLRKSSSSKELRQASAGYIAYSKTPVAVATISPQSNLQSASPSTSYGFTTNKARIGRALAEGNSKGKYYDDSAFFIPYNGPISPPSSHMSSFGITTDGKQITTDRRQYLHLSRDGRSVAPNNEEKRPLTTNGEVQDTTTSSSLTSPKVPFEGLPSAYNHGGRIQASDHNEPARTIGHQSYLPSSMRFDISEKERLAIKGSSSVIAARYQPSYSRLAASPNVSPAQSSVNTKAFPSLEAKSASITSSEGNGSSILHDDSTSTSMTSLRDITNSGNKARYSHDGPPQSSSAKQRARIESTSLGSVKSKARFDDKAVPLLLRPDVALSPGDRVDIEDLKKKAFQMQLSAQEANSKKGRVLIENLDSSPKAASPETEVSKVKYDALQGVYRQEVKTLSEQSSVLEPNSNCERILMPRPNLRGTKFENNGRDDLGEKEEGAVVAFERYRANPGSRSSPLLVDKTGAQDIIGSPGMNSVRSGRQIESGTATPLFHHRMPPPIPDANLSRHSTRPDSVQIPPRRSSQTRKRKTVQSRSQSRTTNAPKVSFQDRDSDALDLSIVLAQGRALEEERARWREQYRRSMIRARSTGTITPEQKRELAEFKKVRYGDSIIPDLPSNGSIHRTSSSKGSEDKAVRRSKSSPNMNRSQFEWHSDRGSFNDGAAACIDFNMSNPFQSRTTPKSQQSHLRKRSKSSSNMSGSFTCLPKLYKRARALSTLPINDEKSQKRQQQQPSMPKLEMSGETQIIARQNDLEEEGITSGTGKVPYTKKYNRSPGIDSDTSGHVFSASSADIGRNTPLDELASFAGKHATKYDYKRPTLSNASKSQSNNSDELKQIRPQVVRHDSLGMSQVRESLDESKHERDRDSSLSLVKSLPVPPRRRRSSQTLSPSTTKGTPKEEKSYFESQNQASRSLGNTSSTPGDAYATPGAYYTPPMAPIVLGANQIKEQDNIKLNKNNKAVTEAERSQRSIDGITRESTDESNYSPRSIAAKELWNTDNHSEEAFTDLFFRRPGVFADRDRSNSDATAKPGFDLTPRRMKHQYFIEEASPRKSKDSMYRSSLHGKRDSLEIEKMVGSYIEGISNDGTCDEAIQHEPAWNDSTTNVYRQEILRIGRVGDRRPEFQPAYTQDDEYIHDPSHDESIGPASSRGRLGSYAASLIMATDTPELAQDEKEKETTAEENDEDEHRISDVSLANMVRDYIWPTSPKEEQSRK